MQVEMCAVELYMTMSRIYDMMHYLHLASGILT